jgi:hypothetical protein
MKQVARVSVIFFALGSLLACSASSGESSIDPSSNDSVGSGGAKDPKAPALDEATAQLLAPGNVANGRGGAKQLEGVILTTVGSACTTADQCLTNLVNTDFDGCNCYDSSNTCTIAPDGSGTAATYITQPYSGQWGGLGTGTLVWMTGYTPGPGGFGYRRSVGSTFYSYGSYDVAYAIGTLGCKVADHTGVYMPTASRTMGELRSATNSLRTPYGYNYVYAIYL